VVEHISWQLDDPTLAALSSEALPVDAPVLADWQSFFGITITGCPAEDFNGVFCNSLSTFFIRAHVTSAIKNSGGDSDGDGIADAEDACPNSDLSSTVVIDSCDSGVPNQLSTEGCTTTDQIVDCTEAAINHRAFVRCVQALTTRLASAHLITNRQKSAIDRCAVRADIP
jgi:hypothetical protein